MRAKAILFFTLQLVHVSSGFKRGWFRGAFFAHNGYLFLRAIMRLPYTMFMERGEKEEGKRRKKRKKGGEFKAFKSLATSHAILHYNALTNYSLARLYNK